MAAGDEWFQPLRQAQANAQAAPVPTAPAPAATNAGDAWFAPLRNATKPAAQQALQAIGGAAERTAQAAGPYIRALGDVLSAGQYASANVANDLTNGGGVNIGADIARGVIPAAVTIGKTFVPQGSAPDKALNRLAQQGERGSYIDVLQRTNLPPWAKTVAGFALDVGLDPSTYLTFGEGALVKASVPKLGSVSVGKVPNLSEKARAALAKTPGGRRVLTLMHPAGVAATVGPEFADAYTTMQRVARDAFRQAVDQNLPMAQAKQALAKKLGMSDAEFADLVEHKTPGAVPSMGIPAEDLGPHSIMAVPTPAPADELQGFAQQYKQAQADRLAKEQAAGVQISALDSDVIDYMKHFLTPEARKAIGKKDAKRKLVAIIGGRVQHESTKQRKLADMPVSEINALAEQGKMIKGFHGKMFVDDPVVANTVRDIVSNRALAAADFIRQVADNPDYAVAVKEGEHPPAGFRKLGDAAQKRYGPLVKDTAFASDVADALDTYVEHAQEIGDYVNLYDNILNKWKGLTLGASPKWMANNLAGNLYNAWLAGINPAALGSAFRIITKGTDGAGTYIVKPGDTLSQVADKFGVDAGQIAKVNGIKNPDRVLAGQTLAIPDGNGVKGLTDQAVLRLAQANGVLFGGLYGHELQRDVADAAREGLFGTPNPVTPGMTPTQAAAAAAKTVGKRVAGSVFRANQGLENYVRLALFVDGLKKGMSAQDAAQRVRKYLFDYAQLSDFDKKVMRRIVPFWSWIRLNTPLQAGALLSKPGRSALPYKLTTALQANHPYIEPTAVQPDYMQNELKAQIGGNAGPPRTAQILNLGGALPAQSLVGLLPSRETPLSESALRGLGAAGNPGVNAAMAGLGIDPYTGQAIGPRDIGTLLGQPLNKRTATAATEVLPPLGAVDRFVAPHRPEGMPSPGIGQRALNTVASVSNREVTGVKPGGRGLLPAGDIATTLSHADRLVTEKIYTAEHARSPAEARANLLQAKAIAKNLGTAIQEVMRSHPPPDVAAMLALAADRLNKHTQMLVALSQQQAQ